MKVLVVNTVSFCRNGISNVIFNIFKEIDRKKIQMDFVATDDKTEQWARELIRENGGKLFQINKSYSHILTYIKELSKCLKEYDAIHIHGNSSSMVFELIAAKMAGIDKRIVHSHNTTCGSPYLDKLLRPLFYRLCDIRLACGEDAGRWMYKNRVFQVINNGIDTELYRYCEKDRIKERSKWGISNEEELIGHVGRLNQQKNQTYLLEIFKRLVINNNKIKLILIGDGPLEKELRSKADRIGISDKVIFAGAINNVNVLLNAIDIIVMPSLYEGLPLTLIEEQANGLVCIVSDTITEEVNISGNVRFASLNDDKNVWTKIVEDEIRKNLKRSRNNQSTESIKRIRKKGFDICESVKKLNDLYNR